MRLISILKAPLAGLCFLVLASCTDLGPIRAELDDLKSQVVKLQADTAKAGAAANTTAGNASLVAMQKTVRQLQSETNANLKAIEALDQKIDRMFKRPLSKQAATGE